MNSALLLCCSGGRSLTAAVCLYPQASAHLRQFTTTVLFRTTTKLFFFAAKCSTNISDQEPGPQTGMFWTGTAHVPTIYNARIHFSPLNSMGCFFLLCGLLRGSRLLDPSQVPSLDRVLQHVRAHCFHFTPTTLQFGLPLTALIASFSAAAASCFQQKARVNPLITACSTLHSRQS